MIHRQYAPIAKLVSTVGVCWLSSPAAGQVSCFLQHMTRIASCQTNYNNPNPNPPATYNNPQAYQACLDGSEADKDLCEAGDPGNARETLWQQLQNNLDACIDQFASDQAALQTCVDSALDTYLDDVEAVLNPPDDGCGSMYPVGPTGQPRLVGEIRSLRFAPEAVNGVMPVSMQTSLSLQAGVSTQQGSAYNVSQVQCIQHAALVAASRGPNGIELSVIGVDMDTTDGVNFDVPLTASRFVGADEIVLITLFVNDAGDARFAETALLSIQPSPIAGDWNRDGVKDTQDVSDFATYYNLLNTRTDVNEDENIDYQDLEAFLDEFAG